MKNTFSGIDPLNVSTGMPEKNDLPKPPHSALASPNAMEYPRHSHKTETNVAIPKHCIKTESTFLEVTSPA